MIIWYTIIMSEFFYIELPKLWNEFNFFIAIGILVAYAVIDALNTHYTAAVAQKRPVVAASSGAIVYILIAFGIISFTENILYLIPLVIGSWTGTFFVVRFQRGGGS